MGLSVVVDRGGTWEAASRKGVSSKNFQSSQILPTRVQENSCRRVCTRWGHGVPKDARELDQGPMGVVLQTDQRPRAAITRRVRGFCGGWSAQLPSNFRVDKPVSLI